MDPLQFCYWLQGFSELSGNNPPTPEQWKSIREHLQLVFKKVTPPVPNPFSPDFPRDGVVVKENDLKPIIATCSVVSSFNPFFKGKKASDVIKEPEDVFKKEYIWPE